MTIHPWTRLWKAHIFIEILVGYLPDSGMVDRPGQRPDLASKPVSTYILSTQGANGTHTFLSQLWEDSAPVRVMEPG
jgi:hypothetical protein